MPDLSNFEYNGQPYNLKDASARRLLDKFLTKQILEADNWTVGGITQKTGIDNNSIVSTMRTKKLQNIVKIIPKPGWSFSICAYYKNIPENYEFSNGYFGAWRFDTQVFGRDVQATYNMTSSEFYLTSLPNYADYDFKIIVRGEDVSSPNPATDFDACTFCVSSSDNILNIGKNLHFIDNNTQGDLIPQAVVNSMFRTGTINNETGEVFVSTEASGLLDKTSRDFLDENISLIQSSDSTLTFTLYKYTANGNYVSQVPLESNMVVPLQVIKETGYQYKIVITKNGTAFLGSDMEHIHILTLSYIDENETREYQIYQLTLTQDGIDRQGSVLSATSNTTWPRRLRSTIKSEGVLPTPKAGDYIYCDPAYSLSVFFYSSSPAKKANYLYSTGNVGRKYVFQPEDENKTVHVQLTDARGNSYYFGTDERSIEKQKLFFVHYTQMKNITPLELYSIYDQKEIEEKLQQLHWNKIRSSDEDGWNNFTLLHFSDIHADSQALKRIVAFKDYYSNFITDAIHTGDTVSSNINQTNIFPDTPGAETILNTIGNHDANTAVTGTGHFGANETTTFNKIIAPNYLSWNINNNDELNNNLSNSSTLATKCYYYKDYQNSAVRLITLDPMHIYTRPISGVTTSMPTVTTTAGLAEDPQLIWFNEVLEDALTNQKHIIIACHVLLRYGSGLTPIKSGFNNMITQLPNPFDNNTIPLNKGANAYPVSITALNPPDVAGGAVNYEAGYCAALTSFVDRGGKVICWICGHRHIDILGTVLTPNNNKILNISIGTALSSRNRTKEMRALGDRTQDLFNLYGVNEELKLLKVMRVGKQYDGTMQKADTFCWNYSTGEMLYTS